MQIKKISKKLIFYTSLSVLAGIQLSEATPADLEKRKVLLVAEVEKQVKNYKCLISLIDRKEALFPIQAQGGFSSREQYFNYITDMKINANKAQTKAKRMISDWPMTKNQPSDLKALDVKVSEELRAEASYVVQAFNAIATQIEKLSKGKEKIDAKKCGVPGKLQ